MMDITIPGTGKWRIKQLVLDLNGTIALDGKIIEGVAERLNHLRRLLDSERIMPFPHSSNDQSLHLAC